LLRGFGGAVGERGGEDEALLTTGMAPEVAIRARWREVGSVGGELHFHMVWLDLGGGATVAGGKGVPVGVTVTLIGSPTT